MIGSINHGKTETPQQCFFFLNKKKRGYTFSVILNGIKCETPPNKNTISTISPCVCESEQRREKSGLYCVRGPRINENLSLDIKLQEPSRLENHHNV